jgi:photosystem II stability/assembly factor-like uncharacterized protein
VKLAWIAVLALVLTMSGAAQARTSRQAVPTSIAFWDRNHGLASFVVYGPNDRFDGYVSVTSDGGRTWKTRWRGNGVSDVATVRGTLDGWARVWPPATCADCRAAMIRTRDGGRTWRRAGTAPSMPSFPTRRTGFAMRSSDKNAGDLLRTSDGGHTWTRAGSPCRRGWGGFAYSAALSFVSPRHGWVLCNGQPSGGGQSKALYVTTDGGVRWKRLVNAFFEPGRVRLGALRSGYAGGISFTRRGHGLMWSARGHTLRTQDGGRSWRPISATLPGSREGLSGWLVTDRLGYLLRQNTVARRRWVLLRTADGGRSWRPVHSWPLR